MLAGQRPRPKRRDDGVELAADARDLRLRDPVQAERLHQVVDLPRRDAVHVRFLDDRQQRVLGPPARLQQRREVGPGPDLRESPARSCPSACPTSASGCRCDTPCARPCARAARRRSARRPPFPSAPARAPGCPPAAHPRPAPRGACQRTPTDPFWASPSRQHLRVVLLPPERTHGKMRDGGSAVYAAGLTEFPPRPGTLTQSRALMERLRSVCIYGMCRSDVRSEVLRGLPWRCSHPSSVVVIAKDGRGGGNRPPPLAVNDAFWLPRVRKPEGSPQKAMTAALVAAALASFAPVPGGRSTEGGRHDDEDAHSRRPAAFHRHGAAVPPRPQPQRVYTEGAKFVADAGGAYWLLDAIAICQQLEPRVKAEEFQVWKLTVARTTRPPSPAGTATTTSSARRRFRSRTSRSTHYALVREQRDSPAKRVLTQGCAACSGAALLSVLTLACHSPRLSPF